MWLGGYFFWIILAPVFLIGGLFLLFIVSSITGFSLIDLFASLNNQSTTLTCWHCGKETPADRRLCRHCKQELQ
ncbi:MAG: hypothetical protein KDA78_05105 [Planctomycetaceae bacterium]|nr:hypothetical protein [Planctomycetaceae bacterium]